MADGTTQTVETQAQRRKRRLRVGVVSSDKGDKTIKVVCTYMIKFPKYGKYVRRRTVLHAHDEKNEASTGDRVEVMECRPISKTKHWNLVRVIRHA
ncbi:MAG: 30S ribosomal protein S17 [Planctomycetes bacterium]|nr:30S ribosomal protein S17 [Planctomycetota bacterium]